jgi:arylsulfatase A-like enzyme
MEIQEMTAHIAQTNKTMRAASEAMTLAQSELDRRQALIDNYREGVRHHEHLIGRLYQLFNEDNIDDARDLVRDEFRSIHGPRD